MNKSLLIKQLSPTEFDITVPQTNRDAHLRLEGGVWVIDVFDSAAVPQREHLHSDHFPGRPADNGIAAHDGKRPDWNTILSYLADL